VRILVTGATGFVGRAVAKDLAARGHELRALARNAVATLPCDMSVVRGDLLDGDSLSAAVRGVEIVVHLAAVVDPRLQNDAALVDRVNRAAAVDLAHRARSAGVSRFVFMSSIAAMGFASGLATAASACAPDTPYGAAKLAAERAIRALDSEAFRVIVLRPPTVYGPGERANFLSLTRAVHGGFFRPIGSGHNVLPLATTDNVARAVAGAAAGSVPAGIHLVADADRYTMKRVYAALATALGRRPSRVTIPVPVALLAGRINVALGHLGAPVVLSPARVRTLTADIPMDVSSLLAAGVELDAPLESFVAHTVTDYERRGLLA
jgi:nucleoside-diphosphate-sugar epimerase